MTEQVLSGYPVTSRFTLLPTPIVNPGKCAVCGAVDRPVIDFNATIQFYGAILLCTNCICEAAEGVGMVKESLLIAVRAELAQSLEAQLRARNLVAVSDEYLFTIRGILTSLSDSIFPSIASSDDVVATETRETESTLFDTLESDDSGDDSESNSSESTDIEELVGSNGDSEQVFDFTVSEGPVSISTDRGDGSTAYAL